MQTTSLFVLNDRHECLSLISCFLLKIRCCLPNDPPFLFCLPGSVKQLNERPDPLLQGNRQRFFSFFRCFLVFFRSFRHTLNQFLQRLNGYGNLALVNYAFCCAGFADSLQQGARHFRHHKHFSSLAGTKGHKHVVLRSVKADDRVYSCYVSNPNQNGMYY